MMLNGAGFLEATLLPALLAGVCGAIIGSYVGVIVVRWPRGEQTMRGRSVCDGCSHRLVWFEMLPVISWLLLRGRCRQCDARIDRVQPLCEGLGAAIGFVAFFSFPPVEALAWFALLILLLPIALLDARHFWIPDRLSYSLAFAGLLFGGPTSDGTDISVRLVGAGAAYLMLEGLRRFYRILRQREGMGGGDPKLAAAIALWCSPLDLPLLLLAATVIGIGAIMIGVSRPGEANRLPFGTCMALAVALMPAARSILPVDLLA